MSTSLLLEKQLCFRLYRLHKAMNRLYNPVLKTLKLTYPQYLVMLVLWQVNTGISVKTLGEKLDLDSGTLSPLLKRLEKIGYITRSRSVNDERHVNISLTEQGKTLKHSAEEVPALMLAKTGLSVEALQQFSQQLDVLLYNINTS
jgi:DNA-binding MarR family transcriptional regulator